MDETRSIVLIDGEHHPSVIVRALEQVRREGSQPVVALLIGGTEKLGQVTLDVGIDVLDAAEDTESKLASAIEAHKAEWVIDLSDEPVMTYERRCRLASVAVWKGAAYSAADFDLTPPARPRLCKVPSIAVIGTGKRTGKTAVSAAVARTLGALDRNPVIVAMGRGGPEEPEVIGDPSSLTLQSLVDISKQGRHAASDHFEGALFSGVPTVGSWRAGGGFVGSPSHTNFEDAVKKANELNPGVLILEGSGSAVPPVHFDAGILIVDAGIDPSHLCGYFGLYRLLLADLVVLTMVEESIPSEQLALVESCLRNRPLSDARVLSVRLRPSVSQDVSGKKVWLATTAPRQAGELIRKHLNEKYGAEVIGVSHSLSNRPQLDRDLAEAEGADVLITELKAAGVDVVARFAQERSLPVAFLENRPESADSEDLEGSFEEVAVLAAERFGK